MKIMDIPWGSDGSRKFATNVGLITSNGPFGHNVMSAEWTHHVSYSPGLIMVNVGFDKATEANIKASKEFGVNLAATDQNIFTSIAGNNSGKEVDKISILKEMGAELYKAKKIDAMMIKGAALNAECKLVKTEKLGDHMMFVGEVVELAVSEKDQIVYSGGKYWKLGDNIPRPGPEVMEKINKMIESHRKK